MTPVDDAAPRDHTAAARPADSVSAGVPAAVPARGRTVTDRQIDQDIPYGVRIAASWSWRLGLIILMAGALVWRLGAEAVPEVAYSRVARVLESGGAKAVLVEEGGARLVRGLGMATPTWNTQVVQAAQPHTASEAVRPGRVG